MKNWKLSEIARIMGTTVPELFEDVEITGVAVDLADVSPGVLFVPLEDDQGNSYHLAEDAVSQGARAVIWREGAEGSYPDKAPVVKVRDTREALLQLAAAYLEELPVRTIAVTGSEGKTTTKDMLTGVLSTTYRVFSYNPSQTDPLADLACSLLQMPADTEMAVFELGWNEKADIELQARLLKPEAAIITNVGETHLLQLGTRRDIAGSQARIARALKPRGLLVYNGDEPLLEVALEQSRPDQELLTYRFGAEDTNDMYPIAMLNEPDGTSFKTNLPGASYYRIPMLGIHNIMNALAAVTVSKYMGVMDQDIAESLKQLDRSYSRLIPLYTRTGAVILNDALSASPTSMRAAIELLKDLPGYERKIVVLGDMVELGPEEIRFHKEIGALLRPPEICKVFAYGTLAKHIALEANKGMPAGRVRWFQEKAELIDAVAAEARNGDAILVKGSRMMGLDELVEVLTGV